MIPPARRDPREAPGSVSTMDYRRIEGNVAGSCGEVAGPDRTLLSWQLGVTVEMGPSARKPPPPCHSERPEGATPAPAAHRRCSAGGNPRGAQYSDGAENRSEEH